MRAAPMLSLASRLAFGRDCGRGLACFRVRRWSISIASCRHEDAPDNFIDRAEALTEAYRAASSEARIDAMRQILDRAERHGLCRLAGGGTGCGLAAGERCGCDGCRQPHRRDAERGYDNSAVRWAQALESGDGSLGWALLAWEPRESRCESAVTGRAITPRPMACAVRCWWRALPVLPGSKPPTSTRLPQMAALPWSAVALERGHRCCCPARGKGDGRPAFAAVGMQTGYWSEMSPAHLFHIVAALHRVGLDPEARMIAAEAVMRT